MNDEAKVDLQITVTGIEFGKSYRDKVTEFAGVATSVTLSQTGRKAVGLETLDAYGRPVFEWIDAERLAPFDDDDIGA